MYELLILSLLMHWPLHAYLLAKIANRILGPDENISAGTLSSLLAKTQRAGLIMLADPATVPFPTDRPSRAFTLTDAGRDRFLQLMIDTSDHQNTYRRLFHIKSLSLSFLPLGQQLFLAEHYLAFCHQVLEAKTLDKQDMAEHPLKQEHMTPELRAASFALMQLKTEQWQRELAWAESIRDQILWQLKQSEEDKPG